MLPAIGVVAVLAVGVAGWLVFAGDDEDDTGPAASADTSCDQLAGTNTERLATCLDEAGSPTMSEGALDALGDVVADGAGGVLVVGDRVDTSARQTLLADDADLRTALLDDDEAAAVAALRAREIAGVVVHRELADALDRDDAVLARLANHDHLEVFELRWVADDALVYAMRSNAAALDERVGTELLAGLRARLARARRIPRQSWQPPGDVRMLASLRLQGETLVLRHQFGSELEGALDDLAAKLQRRWEREVETSGLGSLDERLDEIRIEVHVVNERAPVDVRDEAGLEELWELGVDGAIVSLEAPDPDSEGRFAFMPASEAVTHGLRTADAFLQHTVREQDWPALRPWQDDDVDLFLIRDDHFIDRKPGGGEAVRLVRGTPAATMDELSDENIREMLVAGADWWVRNQRSDNSYLYKYWPDQNRVSAEYNEVRHILGGRDLADAWHFRQDRRYLAGARKAMEWLLQFEVRDTDRRDPSLPHPGPESLLFRVPLERRGEQVPNQKLGTVALALLAWIEWAEATGSHAEDDRIRRMARYTLSQAEDTGRFRPYNVPIDHPYYNSVNDIVPGEAALALARVAEYFDEDQWLEFFPKFLEYYEGWFGDRAERKRNVGRWPYDTYEDATRLELVQFGPWAVMACQQYYELTKNERAAAFGLEIADWLIDNYQWSSDRAPWPEFIGGYFKIPYELPAMQAFVYGEATAAAYRTAIDFAPERKQKYDRATRETIRFMRVMQYDEFDSYFASRPELVIGNIKYAMNEPKVRIDYLGHAMSTLSQYLDARAADPDVDFTLRPQQVTGGPALAPDALPPGGGDVEQDPDEPAE